MMVQSEVVMLSSVCGMHFDDDCPSCASAKQSNDERVTRTPAVATDEGVVEVVALAMAKEIGWGTFSHFDPDDMRRVARAAISAMAHRGD
jgi:hypothetical protein